MAAPLKSKPCQANDNGMTCGRDARAKCFHCSHDLCLIHLTEHTQLVESQTRTSVYSYEKLLSDLSIRLQSLSISSRVSQSPFVQLEKWRVDAHEKLDHLAEQKREEIQARISEYQIQFGTKTHEQKQKIEQLKKRLNDLSRQTNVADKDLKYLEERIEESKCFVQSVDKHSIKVSTFAFFVNIRTHFFDTQQTSRNAQPTPPTGTQPMRNSRPEIKEPTHHGSKQRLDKKRSLSVSLL